MEIGIVEGIAIAVISGGIVYSLRSFIKRIIDFRFPKSKEPPGSDYAKNPYFCL
jgi:hypothetical protein